MRLSLVPILWQLQRPSCCHSCATSLRSLRCFTRLLIAFRASAERALDESQKVGGDRTDCDATSLNNPSHKRHSAVVAMNAWSSLSVCVFCLRLSDLIWHPLICIPEQDLCCVPVLSPLGQSASL